MSGEGGTVKNVILNSSSVTGYSDVSEVIGYNSGTASGNYYYSSTADTTGATRLCTLMLDTAYHYVLAGDTGTIATTENTIDAPDLIQV